VDEGAVIGRMSDIELEEQLVQTQTEIDRANADHDRLLGELRAYGESIARTEVSLWQRQIDYDESNSEQLRIKEREGAEPKAENLKHLTASIAPIGASVAQPAAAYPAAIAILQSDADLRRAKLSEAGFHLDRTRRLYAQGIVPRSELDGAETRASTLAIELTAALERLEAALVEHRRRHASLATEMQLAHSDVVVGQLQAGKLEGELRSARALTKHLGEGGASAGKK
jgi:multidrug resistance efflux pump